MTHRTCEDPGNDRIPQELEDRLRRALDAEPPRPGRLPVWVAAACLGAAVLSTPACGKKEREADIPKPPAGLETALMKPDAGAMDPGGMDPGGMDPGELESQDPMDPLPGQMDPPPGSMEPIPPPTRGADLRPGEEPPPPTEPVPSMIVSGVMYETPAVKPEGLGGIMGTGEGLSGVITANSGVAYGAPPMGPMTAQRPPTVKENLVNSTGGKLAPDLIRRVVRRYIPELRHCYESALQRKPTLAGKITAQFVIGVTGAVEACKVQRHLDVQSVGDCLCARVLRWRFPEPEGGRVIVTYDWTFSPPQD